MWASPFATVAAGRNRQGRLKRFMIGSMLWGKGLSPASFLVPGSVVIMAGGWQAARSSELYKGGGWVWLWTGLPLLPRELPANSNSPESCLLSLGIV